MVNFLLRVESTEGRGPLLYERVGMLEAMNQGVGRVSILIFPQKSGRV